MQISRIVPRLAALALLFSLVAWPAAPTTHAQTTSTAEEAVRSLVATTLGVPAEDLIVRFIAETGGWAYASATQPAGSDQDAPIVTYVLAHNTGDGWIAERRFTAEFDALLRDAPADFPNAAVRAAIDGVNLAGDGSADLSFPFPVGETWRFNGPHPNGPGRVWSSLDFYRLSGGFELAYDAPILAMRGGVVDLPCANMVVVDHGDGWMTYYYHVINITVTEGQTVTRGQRVGGTSAEFRCGGAADGPHSHIWTTWQGVEVAIAGTDIGGWTVSAGSQPYDGCLTRDTVVLCRERGDSVRNDGLSGSYGSVSLTPARSTVNNWLTYNVDNLPSNTSGEIRWRRMSGSVITAGEFTTNGAGVASGRFRVPATPGGAGQRVTFVAGGVERSTSFEVAPRIKLNTNPGQRGGQVDVSLRGYAKKEVVRIRWYRPDVGWEQLATVTTSNTGSANVWVTVPNWAPDGPNKVRGDGEIFRQQTNTAMIAGGARLELAGEVEAAPTAEVATPEATVEPTETTPAIDRTALPVDPPQFGQVEPVWTLDPVTNELVATLDTGAPHHIHTVGWLVTASDCAPISRIEFSSDGVNWTAFELTEPAEPGVWQAIWPDLEAQWLRWVSNATDPAVPSGCLAETAVWASELPTGTEPTEPPLAEETGTPTPASEEATGP